MARYSKSVNGNKGLELKKKNGHSADLNEKQINFIPPDEVSHRDGMNAKNAE